MRNYVCRGCDRMVYLLHCIKLICAHNRVKITKLWYAIMVPNKHCTPAVRIKYRSHDFSSEVYHHRHSSHAITFPHCHPIVENKRNIHVHRLVACCESSKLQEYDDEQQHFRTRFAVVAVVVDVCRRLRERQINSAVDDHDIDFHIVVVESHAALWSSSTGLNTLGLHSGMRFLLRSQNANEQSFRHSPECTTKPFTIYWLLYHGWHARTFARTAFVRSFVRSARPKALRHRVYCSNEVTSLRAQRASHTRALHFHTCDMWIIHSCTMFGNFRVVRLGFIDVDQVKHWKLSGGKCEVSQQICGECKN